MVFHHVDVRSPNGYWTRVVRDWECQRSTIRSSMHGVAHIDINLVTPLAIRAYTTNSVVRGTSGKLEYDNGPFGRKNYTN